MQLIKEIKVTNNYSGNGWNFEKTTKYILGFGEYQLEAGYFEHYNDDIFVKAVVEIPVSYGCPAHCKFCATSAIDSFVPLESYHMREIFEYIWTAQKLEKKQYVLLSVTGTGDLNYNFSNVVFFLSGLTLHGNLHVTLSSCMWNAQHLKEIECLSEKIAIRNVQITHISVSEEKVTEVIPAYGQCSEKLDEILAYIGISEKMYYRFNYIIIDSLNDTEEDFYDFINKIESVKEKVVVRISKLNQTASTRRNNLYPAKIEKMKKFKSMLTDAGINSYLFYAYKNDQMNCGQLLTEKVL